MAWTKAKTAVVVAASVLVVAGAIIVIMGVAPKNQPPSAFVWEDPNFNTNTLREAPPQVTIVPSKFPAVRRTIVTDVDSDKSPVDKAQLMGLGIDLEGLLQHSHHGGVLQHVALTNVPAGQYDFIANLPTGSRAALAELIQKQFGFIAKRETVVEKDALVLTADHSNAPGMQPASPNDGTLIGMRDGKRFLPNETTSDLASFLEAGLNTTVTDHTGLTGNYDFQFSLLAQPGDDHDGRIERAKKVVFQELGLKLIDDPGLHEVLIIKKTN